jgi:cytochrome P450
MFVFAGFEGTASAAANLLIQLSKNPTALKKVSGKTILLHLHSS